MQSLPCVITYPIKEALELIRNVSDCPVKLKYTSPIKKDYLGKEERIIAQRMGSDGSLILVVAYEQVIA